MSAGRIVNERAASGVFVAIGAAMGRTVAARARLVDSGADAVAVELLDTVLNRLGDAVELLDVVGFEPPADVPDITYGESRTRESDPC